MTRSAVESPSPERGSRGKGSAAQAELCLLRLDVDAVQPREVLAQDLPLGRLGQLRVAPLLDDVARQLEVPQRLERPLGVPDRGLAAVDDLVLTAPPHHLPERLCEDPW